MAASNHVDLASVDGGEAKPHALKPLEELSDADIRQLTREDCRRYLKERGMRRPSWNKAQAIQQVLSLRSLMCSSTKPKPDSGEAENVPQTKQLLDKVSHHQSSSTANNPSDDPRHSAANNPVIRPAIQKPHRAQLTIFYSGVVKVYEDVSFEKAQAIMLLAASKTFQVPTTNPALSSSTIGAPQATNQQQVYASAPPFPAETMAAATTTVSLHNSLHEESTDSGLPQARTISLQRFLAKRRERISANPSFYRRCDKHQQANHINKRSKPSSSSPPRPAPHRRTLSSSTTINNNDDNRLLQNNFSSIISGRNNNINERDFSSASSSENASSTGIRASLNNYLDTRSNLVRGTF